MIDSISFCTFLKVTQSLLATLIGFWNNYPSPTPIGNTLEIEQSCRLIELFRKSEFLPPSLCYPAEIFQKISCKDISRLLMICWNFLQTNPISPELFDPVYGKRDFSNVELGSYLDNIKAVLRDDAVILGEAYSRFFHHQSFK